MIRSKTSLSGPQLSQLYRRFANHKYGKYRHQFPRMRQSQLTSKIIKQWEGLSGQQKEQLYNTYLKENFFQESQSQCRSLHHQSQDQRPKRQIRKELKKETKKIIRDFKKSDSQSVKQDSDFQRDKKTLEFDCESSESEIGLKKTKRITKNLTYQKFKEKKKIHESRQLLLQQYEEKTRQIHIINQILQQLQVYGKKYVLFDIQKKQKVRLREIPDSNDITKQIQQRVYNDDFMAIILGAYRGPLPKNKDYLRYFREQFKRQKEICRDKSQTQIAIDVFQKYKKIVEEGRHIVLKNRQTYNQAIKRTKRLIHNARVKRLRSGKSLCGKQVSDVRKHQISCQQCYTVLIVQYPGHQEQKRPSHIKACFRTDHIRKSYDGLKTHCLCGQQLQNPRPKAEEQNQFIAQNRSKGAKKGWQTKKTKRIQKLARLAAIRMAKEKKKKQSQQ